MMWVANRPNHHTLMAALISAIERFWRRVGLRMEVSRPKAGRPMSTQVVPGIPWLLESTEICYCCSPSANIQGTRFGQLREQCQQIVTELFGTIKGNFLNAVKPSTGTSQRGSVA